MITRKLSLRIIASTSTLLGYFFCLGDNCGELNYVHTDNSISIKTASSYVVLRLFIEGEV